MWVITREVNAYDQYGEYFVCAFTDKPTIKEIHESIKTLGWDCLDYAEHVSKGGGRRMHEGEWLYMKEFKDGEVIE